MEFLRPNDPENLSDLSHSNTILSILWYAPHHQFWCCAAGKFV